jgi:hypothetical protein
MKTIEELQEEQRQEKLAELNLQKKQELLAGLRKRKESMEQTLEVVNERIAELETELTT